MRHLCLFLVLGSTQIPAQSLLRLVPEAAAPGDLIVIEGTLLGGATSVRFEATVGGFVGVWVVSAAPSSVGTDRLVVTVPTMAGFAPPNASPPGVPIGMVSVAGPGISNSLPFFYIQAEPTVDTPGTGSLQSGSLLGAPVLGFTAAGGAPLAGNAAFTLTLGNTLPGSTGLLAIGSLASPPFLPLGSGTIVLDFTAPILVLTPGVTDANGLLAVPISLVGAPPGVTIAVQWGVINPNDGSISITAGLSTSW